MNMKRQRERAKIYVEVDITCIKTPRKINKKKYEKEIEPTHAK